MEKNKVSVLISSYNHEAFVGDTIKSILNQSYDNLELIVVDDFSSDNTYNVIKSFNDDRIRLYRNSFNKGFVQSINFLLSLADGEYIAFCGSDDIWYEDKLKKQVAYLNKNTNCDVVFSDVDYIDENNNIFTFDDASTENKIFKTHFDGTESFVNYLFFSGNCLCHPSALIRTSIVKKIGYFNCGLAQLHDYDYWMRLSQCGNFYVIKDRLLKYRRIQNNNKSISASTKVNALRTCNEWSFIILSFIKNIDKDRFAMYFSQYMAKTDLSKNCDSDILLICDKFFLLKKWAKKNYNFYWVPVIFLFNYINDENILKALSEYGYSLQAFYKDFANLFSKYPFDYYDYYDNYLDLEKAFHERGMYCHGLEEQIHNMKNSISWKLTKPLRAIKKLLK